MQCQQIIQCGRLWSVKLSFYIFQPADQRGDFLLCLPQHGVGFAKPAVEVALVGADALRFHCADRLPLMDGRNLFNALTGIAAVVNATV